MHSTPNTQQTNDLNPKQADDPHDVLVIAPDAVRAAPADEELSSLLRDAARRSLDTQARSLDTQARAGSESPAGPPVPPVDTTFRPAVVNDVLGSGHRWSMGRPAVRAFVGLFLAACIGLAAVAWQSDGDAARRMIANWTTQPVATSSPPPEQPGPSAQPAAPAVQASQANAAPSQPAPPAETATQVVAPAAPAVQADAAKAAPPAPPAQTAPQAVAPAAAASPDQARLLQSMARDVASLGQEVGQLKASIEQIKAGQQQLSRDVARASDQSKASDQAKASEQNPRPRTSAPPPRSAAARPRRATPAQAQAAPPLPLGPGAYGPGQAEPQAMPPPPADPELASVPRPPMPVR